MLADPVITAIATAHGRTPAQLVLPSPVQQGIIATPKSANPLRLAQNLDIFGFTLSPAEMTALDTLDRPDPAMLNADSFGH